MYSKVDARGRAQHGREFVKGKPEGRGYLQPADEKPATPERPAGTTYELKLNTRAAYASFAGIGVGEQ